MLIATVATRRQAASPRASDTVATMYTTAANAFPDATVWTGFGSGYGFVPLVLPFVGLWWLHHTR